MTSDAKPISYWWFKGQKGIPGLLLCSRMCRTILAQLQWRFKGGQGGQGPRPRTFGSPEGAPHLRKKRKEIAGKHLNKPLWHKNCNEKNLKNDLG